MGFALNANITIVPAAYKPSGTFFRINSLNPNYNGPLHKALCGPTVDKLPKCTPSLYSFT